MGDGGPVTDDFAAGSPAPDAPPPADGYVGDPAVQAEWDQRYLERERLWSGRPNGALVAEVAGLTPGRVLDVGCGEGADAIWLAGQGWDVTALEVSGVALERAAGHARDAGVAVRWVHAGLAEAALPPASFDLVSAQYPALLRTPDAAAERALLAAVAPGGVLLLVHHAGMDAQSADTGGFDPADYVWPSMVAALLDDDWEVEVDEQRPRVVPAGGAGAHHKDDVVLRARRLRRAPAPASVAVAAVVVVGLRAGDGHARPMLPAPPAPHVRAPAHPRRADEHRSTDAHIASEACCRCVPLRQKWEPTQASMSVGRDHRCHGHGLHVDLTGRG
jgi:SAM-dependent methyltransferase